MDSMEAQRSSGGPYTVRREEGAPENAAQGTWIVEGPGILALHFKGERTRAHVVRKALNAAFAAGWEARP